MIITIIMTYVLEPPRTILETTSDFAPAKGDYVMLPVNKTAPDISEVSREFHNTSREYHVYRVVWDYSGPVTRVTAYVEM
jgi:hypothetical protein